MAATSSILGICALGILSLTGCSAATAPAAPPAGEALAPGFALDRASVNGVTIGYMKGGRGPAVLLLHGFPEDMSAWRAVAPMLADRFTVIVPDLRGIGLSTGDAKGFGFPVMAEDMRQLLSSLRIKDAYVVGHDMGGPVGYALARLHPDMVRGVMLVEAPLAGMPSWEKMEGNPALWHIPFHQTPNLPEQLIAGHQDVYVRHFLTFAAADKSAVKETSVQRYALAYRSPSQLRAAMEMYRAFGSQKAFNLDHRASDPRPIVVVSGQTSFGDLGPRMAADLKAWGWRDATSVAVPQAGHYVNDEQPRALADLIFAHAAPDEIQTAKEIHQ